MLTDQDPFAQLELDFATRGLVLLGPQHLGLDASTHASIFARQHQLFRDKVQITSDNVAQISDVLTAPGLNDVCERLLGPHWAIVPYTHNAPFVSGAFDQHWHKDDNGPFNGRRARHHHAVQLEMLYYPQAVEHDMGPTAILPFSQYWTFNHEDNHDNFAGADHLDFAYQLEGMERVPVSGPRSPYSQSDIRARSTAHDQRMQQAVRDVDWPLIQAFEVAPLPAGSVLLYSHNLFHRGNHRRDDFSCWKDQPRFMWRFWLYRTHNPRPRTVVDFATALTTQVPLAELPQAHVDDPASAIWRHHYHWLHGASTPTLERGSVSAWDEALHLSGDKNEPQRINAAYHLAHFDHPDAATTLLRALHNERENVRRAATYGLSAMGERLPLTAVCEAATSANRWVRRAVALVLGEAAPLHLDVIKVLATLLHTDPSNYVRSVAVTGLGSLARQLPGMAGWPARECAQAIIDAVLHSLDGEPNRLAMDKAQGRSIKMVRPTDESDVCEGMGITYNTARFEPVRSSVRECALTTLVILSSHDSRHYPAQHPGLVAQLRRIACEDTNIFSTGLAVDALTRLAQPEHPQAHRRPAQEALDEAHAHLEICCHASITRARCTLSFPTEPG